MSDGLTATAQILGKGTNGWDAEIAWAYFTYQLNDNFSIKGGRQRLPYFLYSDFLDVGYAYHWVAPPAEVYVLGGFDNIDGVNLEYYGDWGAVTSRLNFIVGASTVQSGDLYVSSDDHWVVSWNMNWEWLTFQASYSESLVTVDGINQLADGANELLGGALTPEQIDTLDMRNDRGHFAGVGLAADWGTWFAAAEYTDVGVDNSPLTNEKTSWYLTGGFRTGDLTFSLTYGALENPNNPDTMETLTTAVLPGLAFVRDDPFDTVDNDVASAAAGQILDGMEENLITGVETESYNFTVRWDFHPSAAFKFDYTQEEADYEDENGNITSREPSMVRMGVDLVF